MAVASGGSSSCFAAHALTSFRFASAKEIRGQADDGNQRRGDQGDGADLPVRQAEFVARHTVGDDRDIAGDAGGSQSGK